MEATVAAWSDALAAAVERAEGSVVRVEARCARPASGFAWSDTLVVTTARSEPRSVVLAGGERRAATLVGRDPATDLALLRVEAGGLTPAPLRELDGLKVGHAVLALGRPGTVIRASLRIVGVLGPEVRTPAGGRLDRYVETDRRIPSGFSGGPLVALDGGVVGLNTRALFGGADLCVPVATLRRVIAELEAHGAVRRGYLGVAVQPVELTQKLRDAGAPPHGALVVHVEPGSPAEAGGLLLGDVIVEIAGTPIEGPSALRGAIADRAGQTVKIRIARAGQLLDLDVAVGERR